MDRISFERDEGRYVISFQPVADGLLVTAEDIWRQDQVQAQLTRQEMHELVRMLYAHGMSGSDLVKITLPLQPSERIAYDAALQDRERLTIELAQAVRERDRLRHAR